MKVELFEFDNDSYTFFNQVYVILDSENNRLHLSPVYYNFNLTLDLGVDLQEQLEESFRYGSFQSNEEIKRVFQKIIKDLPNY